jgi:hypothetical protein
MDEDESKEAGGTEEKGPDDDVSGDDVSGDAAPVALVAPGEGADTSFCVLSLPVGDDARIFSKICLERISSQGNNPRKSSKK